MNNDTSSQAPQQQQQGEIPATNRPRTTPRPAAPRTDDAPKSPKTTLIITDWASI